MTALRSSGWVHVSFVQIRLAVTSSTIANRAASQPSQSGAALSLRAASHEGREQARQCIFVAPHYALVDHSAINARLDAMQNSGMLGLMALAGMQVACVAVLVAVIMYRRKSPAVSGYAAQLIVTSACKLIEFVA